MGSSKEGRRGRHDFEVEKEGSPVHTSDGGEHRFSVARAAVLLAGAGLALIVGRDGTLVWQFVRVAVVAGIAAGVFRVSTAKGLWGSIMVFGLGALTMPVGLGYGIQHLDKTGLSPGSAVGAVTFFGGSALLAIGARRLLHGVGRWVRIPAGLALLAVVAVSTWVLAQATAAVNVPRTDLGPATPTDQGVSYEDVTFRTPDGVELSGWYIPSENGAAVALLHGSGSTRSAVLDHALVLAAQGYGVLAYDARGHGRSGGRPMDWGWYGDEDVIGAVSFLVGRPDVDPARIGAVGLSMGGEEAIGAAAADNRLRAVVAEGATSRTAGDKVWLTERYGWRGAITLVIDRLKFGITDLLTAADPPITLRRAVETSGTPMLLIAAGSIPTEQHAAAHIAAGSPATVDVWVVARSGHTGALRTHPVEWESRLVGFLDATLGEGS